MKYLKSLGLAALAALSVMAFMGAGIASASEPKAEPTAPNVFPVGFHGHGGAGSLLTTSNKSVECTTSVSSGEITSASTVQNAVVTFSGCTAFFGFASCTSAGEQTGSIKTNPLHGTLVYLETGSGKKGLLLKPASGTVFASFNCGGTTITVSGEVLGELVAKSHTEYTLHFRRLSNAHPDPASYLSSVGCKHTSTTESLISTGHGGFSPFAASPAGISATQTITLTKPTALGGTGCV
jgi:hypothetical protein